MPIYEFCCNACQHTFEELVLKASELNLIQCPKCGTTNVRKLYSAFGFSSGGKFSSNIGAACTGCAKTTCKDCSK